MVETQSIRTFESYGFDLKQFTLFLEEVGITQFQKVNHLVIRKFLAKLKTEGYAKSSISRKIACIRSLFKYLSRQGYLENNPVLGVANLKREKHLPEFLYMAEVNDLLNLPDKSNKLGIRDAAILEVFYACGIRLQELVDLTLKDL